jgi:hypothetical protein
MKEYLVLLIFEPSLVQRGLQQQYLMLGRAMHDFGNGSTDNHETFPP